MTHTVSEGPAQPPAPQPSQASAGGGRERRGLGPRVGPTITETAPAATIRRRDAAFRRTLVGADIVGATAAFLLAVVIIGGDTPRPLALLGLPLLLLCSKLTGLYDRDELLIDRAVTIDEIPRLFTLSTLFALLAAVTGEVAVRGGLDATSLVALWLGLLVLLSSVRAAGRALALRHTATERCVVIGDADACAQVTVKLDDSPHTNSVVVGYVSIRDKVRADDPQPLAMLPQLDSVLLTHDVHRVIVAPRDTDSDAPLEVVRRVKALGVKVSVLPRIFEVVGSSVEFDDVDGMTVLGVRRFGLQRSSRILKRSFDLAGAVAGLVLVAPLMGVIAIRIKRDSPGPVFFRQRRVGREGEVFEIVKFRTMVRDAEAQKDALRPEGEAQGLFKLADDPRITSSGRWLRRTSLDELPQLLNVARGEMSLVGPRPLVLDEDRQVEGWHRRRLHLKPGMTGPWQILTSDRIPLYEMVKMDYLYIANWSLWLDVKILMRTGPYMLARRGR